MLQRSLLIISSVLIGSMLTETASARLDGGTYVTRPGSCPAPPYTVDDIERSFMKLTCTKKSVSGFDTAGLYYWDRFGFSKGWDADGYGHDDYCNAKLPLGRTLSAFYLLQHSYTPEAADWHDTSGPWVKRMYPYVAGGYNKLDDLRAGQCHPENYSAEQVPGFPFRSDHVIIYQDGFEFDVLERAGTLVHEHRHWREDDGHTCGLKDRYYYNDQYIYEQAGRASRIRYNEGANHISVYGLEGTWYLSYKIHANQNTSKTLKDRALVLAQEVLLERICETESIPQDIKDQL